MRQDRFRTICLLLLTSLTLPAHGDVAIRGVPGDMERAIRAGLSIDQGCEQAAWLVRYRFRAADREIRTVLETFGHYSPTVEPRLAFTETCFEATFDVDPGPATTVIEANIEVRATNVPARDFQDVIDASPVRQTARFDHSQYEMLKSDLQDVAARLGFIEGSFATQRVVVDAASSEARINLIYNAGPRYRFGPVEYDSDRVQRGLLDRYLTFERGDFWDVEALGEFYQGLISAGYFDDVSVRPGEPDAEQKEIPVDVRLVIGQNVRSQVGVGASTDLGPNVSYRRTNRLVNARGHQMNFETTLSPVRSELGGNYRIPTTNRPDSWLSVYGGFEKEDTETSRSTSSTIGIRRVVPLDNRWVETRFLEVRNDDYVLAGAAEGVLTVVPGLNLSYTRTDRLVSRPRKGFRLSGEISGTARMLGSSVGFVKFIGDGKYVRGIGERLRFLGRARIGITETKDFAELPPRVRFFSGGDNRVRGFDYEEIGALDANGNTIGGDRLIELSGEFDVEFRPNWALATFFDAGSVSLSSFNTEFERSIGVGVRWYSPIGPVRVDFARPLGTDRSGFRVHLSLGPDL